MSANVLVDDGAETDLRSTRPPLLLHRNLIARSTHVAVRARRLGLWLIALAGMSACAAETSSSVTTGPTPARCQVAVTTPATVDALGGTASVTVSTQPECVWTTSSALPWISGLTPTTGQGSGRIEFRVAANPNPASREGDVAVNDARARVVQAAAPVSCRYDVTPTTQTLGTSGGEAVLTIASPAGCTWTASGTDSWLVASSATSGNGDGRVTFTAEANSGTDRVATITIGGQAVTVRQTGTAVPPMCNYTLSAAGQAVGSAGGAGSPVTVTTAAGCAWTATSAVPWISITAGGSGVGTGTVSFSVAPNTGAARTGTLTIGDDPFVVSQAEAPPPSCAYAIAPQSQVVGATGGSVGPVAVTTTAVCGWSATSNVPWISVTAGNSGTGTGAVSLLVAANTGAARTGTVSIAGQSFQVDQAAAPTPQCTYSIAPIGETMAATGGAGTPIAVTTTAGCAWTAASNAAWLTITGATSGTGSGSVSFTAGANTGAARTGTLTVAGQVFTVSQVAATVCSYVLNPTSANLSASAGAGPSIAVTAASTCAWTATSGQSWITVTSGSSGTGNGSVGFSVAANTGAARNGAITIGGQVFQVVQAAAPCTYSISPTSASYSRNRADGNTITVTTTSGCAWTSASNVPWVTISANPTGTGPGTTRYDVAQNNTGSVRNGTLTVAGRTFQITQAAN